MAAEAALSFAVQTLGNLLLREAFFMQAGVEEEVEWLRHELERMQGFLKDAAEKQANDERVRSWISEIRAVAEDAEDAIEISVLKVENARRSRGPLGNCASFPNHVYRVNEFGKDIKLIKKRLQDIENTRLMYRIGEGLESTRRSEQVVERRRRLAPWQKDNDVVGLKEDVRLLLEKAILDERKGLSIATIEGMGGIGKSALARMIYNHPSVATQFECRAWVVVSNEFTPHETIKQLMLELQNTEEVRKMIQQLEESTKDKQFLLRKLKDMVHKQLKGKRYFIVLDDVWESRHWKTLGNTFPNGDR